MKAQVVASMLADLLHDVDAAPEVEAARQQLLDSLRLAGGLCPDLRRSIPRGIAYHHSGLTGDERVRTRLG